MCICAIALPPGRHYVSVFRGYAASGGASAVADGAAVAGGGGPRRAWLLLDDSHVRPLGDRWSDAVAHCARGGYQPTVLFYQLEACRDGAWQQDCLS
jgi:hypothetical protein